MEGKFYHAEIDMYRANKKKEHKFFIDNEIGDEGDWEVYQDIRTRQLRGEDVSKEDLELFEVVNAKIKIKKIKLEHERKAMQCLKYRSERAKKIEREAMLRRKRNNEYRRRAREEPERGFTPSKVEPEKSNGSSLIGNPARRRR